MENQLVSFVVLLIGFALTNTKASHYGTAFLHRSSFPAGFIFRSASSYQMGTMMKPAIFEEQTRKRLAKWDRAVKRQKGLREATNGSSQVDPNQASVAVQLAEVGHNESAGEIAPELPLRDEYESFHFEVPFETSPSRSYP